MTKLQQVLEIVSRWEATGKIFFNRNSDGDMTVHLRDPRLWGGNPNVEHWANALEVQSEIQAIARISNIKIDTQAGQLNLLVYGIYK